MKNLAFTLFTAFTLCSMSANAQTATKLYFTQGSATSSLDALKSYDLTTQTVSTLASDAANFTQPSGIVVDLVGGYVYVSDNVTTGLGLLRFSLTGTNRTVIVPATASAIYGGLALDVAAGNLYFTQGSATSSLDALKVVDLTTLVVTTLASDAANFGQPQGIALDKANSKLYIADGNTGQGILRFNTDGTGRMVLIPPVASAIYQGVALDVPHNKMYFTQGSATSSLDALKSANLDGSNVTTLAVDAANFLQPSGITIDRAAGYLYVADALTTGFGILRFDTSGGGRTVVVPATASAIYNGVALDVDNTALPIRLGSLTAGRGSAAVRLSWTARRAEGTERFVVEGSADGRRYEELGEVVVKREEAFASYIWNALLPVGTMHYRVRVDGLDGSVAWTNVATVSGAAAPLQAYPNPVRSGETLWLNGLPEGDAVVQLYSADGRLVWERLAKASKGGKMAVEMDGQLTGGRYWLSVGGQRLPVLVQADEGK